MAATTKRTTYIATAPNGLRTRITPRGRTAWLATPLRPDGTAEPMTAFRLTASDVAGLQLAGYALEKVQG